ncbi:hypothetical protein WA026_005053 [Henosepilachna vigintioctopunctata]|uniref:Uncharacterized protein n=1 Tax=Henosepilachna vigintioctopunctata TaxID=420089 RepID=A0AAW1UVX2_9CUCU
MPPRILCPPPLASLANNDLCVVIRPDKWPAVTMDRDAMYALPLTRKQDETALTSTGNIPGVRKIRVEWKGNDIAECAKGLFLLILEEDVDKVWRGRRELTFNPGNVGTRARGVGPKGGGADGREAPRGNQPPEPPPTPPAFLLTCPVRHAQTGPLR